MNLIKEIELGKGKTAAVSLFKENIIVYLANRNEQYLRLYDPQLKMIKEVNLKSFANVDIQAIAGLTIDNDNMFLNQNNRLFFFDKELNFINEIVLREFKGVYFAYPINNYLVGFGMYGSDIIETRLLVVDKSDFTIIYKSAEPVFVQNALYSQERLITKEEDEYISIYDFPAMNKRQQFYTGKIGYSNVHKSEGGIGSKIMIFDNLIIFPVFYEHFLAIDINTGAIVWDKIFDDTPSCIFIENDIIYYVSNTNKYYHIDPRTGNVFFEKDHTQVLDKLELRGLRAKTKPLVLGKNIFICYTESGVVACMDKQTGDLKWHYKCKDSIPQLNVPILIDNKLLIQDSDANLYLFEGEELQ